MDNQQTPNTIPPLIMQAPQGVEETKLDKEKKENKKLYKWIAIVVGLLLLMWLSLTYILGFTVVNGISMKPTFKTGDVVAIWKLPHTWDQIINHDYVPKRGSIVIVKNTDRSGEQFIKRVIATPGEQININEGLVKVTTQDNKFIYPDQSIFTSNTPYTSGSYAGSVGSGEIFVLGDNRDPGASIDSRSSLGSIPDNLLVGQVVFRIWPLNKISIF